MQGTLPCLKASHTLQLTNTLLYCLMLYFLLHWLAMAEFISALIIDQHMTSVGLNETYLCSGSLSSLFSWAAISHYHTVMRSYIFIIIFSWLQADAAVKVWLLKADKSDRLAEVGLNLIGSVCDVLCWLKLAAVRSAAKSSCVCHWCHNKHWLMQWDKVQSFLPSDALSASLTDRSSSS